MPLFFNHASRMPSSFANGDRRSVAKHSQERLLWHPQGKDRLLDARDIPYERVEYNGCSIRTIEIDGERWYSINDVNSSMGSRTESAQSVRRLNAKRSMAQKIWLYGVTQPGWFTTQLGVRLLLCASQKHKAECKQLMLDFNGEED